MLLKRMLTRIRSDRTTQRANRRAEEAGARLVAEERARSAAEQGSTKTTVLLMALGWVSASGRVATCAVLGRVAALRMTAVPLLAVAWRRVALRCWRVPARVPVLAPLGLVRRGVG